LYSSHCRHRRIVSRRRGGYYLTRCESSRADRHWWTGPFCGAARPGAGPRRSSSRMAWQGRRAEKPRRATVQLWPERTQSAPPAFPLARLPPSMPPFSGGMSSCCWLRHAGPVV